LIDVFENGCCCCFFGSGDRERSEDDDDDLEIVLLAANGSDAVFVGDKTWFSVRGGQVDVNVEGEIVVVATGTFGRFCVSCRHAPNFVTS